MTFESTIVPNNWRSDMIPHCTRVKGERNECRNHRGISLLSVVGKISAGILVGIVRRVTEGLIKDEQGGFKSGSKLVRNRRRKSERCMWVLWTWRRRMIRLIARSCVKS